MSDTNEHSLSLSFQIRRAIKAENELQVAQAQVKLLTDQWNALPIKELVVNADYREMWQRQLKMNQQLIASLSAEKQAQPVQVNAMLVEALEEARNGLAWYQAMYPAATDGSDDEAMERIDAVLTAAQQAQPEQPIACMVKGKLLSYKDSLIPEDCFLYLGPQPKQAQPEPVTYTPPKIIDPDAPHPCFN